MDPQAALRELLGQLADDEPDRERVLELLDALRGWIRRGGHLPIARVFGPEPDVFQVRP